MSYWSIPQHQLQVHKAQKKTKGKKFDLFFILLLPFWLAVMGIPVYLLVILKLIALVR